MTSLREAVDAVARRTGFSGVVRVDGAGHDDLAAAYGFVDRAHRVPMTPATQLATASATKAFTALLVVRLVEDGVLRLDSTARSLLGDDLPLIPDDVTVEHLLAHRSGIGDYLDEDAMGDITDYALPVPVQTLTTTESFLPLLDGRPTAFPAGTRFAYNNGGYVVLALLAERATGTGFHDLVRSHVWERAGMTGTDFLRSDELPASAATGYLRAEGLRSNVLTLPVLGNGDGGAYSTAADLRAFWEAVFAGRIVSLDLVAEMTRPHSDWPEEGRRYGLGFHLAARGDGVWLEGYDAGVSMRSTHRPSTGVTCTVISNWTDGAWPVAAALEERLGG